MRPIVVVDMTKLFKKEFLLYSLFDKGLKTPLRVTLIAYYVVIFLMIGLPILLLVKPITAVPATIAFGLPYLLANAFSKPIWGGKKFFSWLSAQINYIFSPKVYYDCESQRELGVFRVYQEIVVSRTEDYKKLARLKKQEIEYGRN